MFGANDPLNMGSLHMTLLTLFRCATLEDWSDIMYTATTGTVGLIWWLRMLTDQCWSGCEHWGYEGREEYCVNSTAKPFMGVLYVASTVHFVFALFFGC